jgi:outer membrane protein assembly factor BamB
MIEIRWERQLHQAGSDVGLAVAAGGLVVHERHTRLVSLDPTDGAVRWDVAAGRWPRALAIAGPHCMVLPQDTSQLLCWDLDTGERVWSVDLPPMTGHLVIADDTVLVGGWRGYTPLRALDAATGQLRWETDDRVHTVRPAATGSGFLIGEPGSTLVRLIDRHGAGELTAWVLPQPLIDSDDRRAFTAVGPHRFLVRCGDRAVAEIVPSAGTMGEFLLAENDLAFSTAEYVGDLIWVPERPTGYTVVDPRDGHVVWRVGLQQHLVGQVVPVRTGVGAGFVLGSTSGTLFHLDTDGRVTERTAVARRIWALRGVGPAQVLALTKGTLLAAVVGNSPHRE